MSSKKASKNILFVTRPLSPPWDEASKNFAYDLACNISEHNITILVDNYISDTPAHITQKKIYTDNHLSLKQKVYLLRYLKRYSNEFDAIHLLFTPTKLNSKIIKKILSCSGRTCPSTPQSKVIQTVATLRDDLYSKEDLQKILFGDIIVTYSKWAQKKLQNLGFDNTHQIYPGLNLSKFTPGNKNAKLMQKWHINKNDFVVTYPGEFARLGATDLIVDTFLKLWDNPSNHNIKYLCACRIKNDADAKKKQDVIKKIKNAGHIDKVIFTDTFGDMNAIYNLSDTIIFPVTNMKGKFDVPLAMIEPYACKKPVITSDLELFKEFSNENINVIVKRDNVGALKNAILNLQKNPQKRINLGENAYKFAHETFDIKKTAQKYQDIYDM